ncbi:hypothetical protein CPJCM30710_17120 [Clostridium polyendosporum]|uniref:DUF5667 domain-containing protein n=1 Tax=Clostridium polyendosporum TaxID=69208 RepID=A0A919RZ81_9CLOT|nr:DUF5667 domain-containing protein [Clostridium polyendosporum]GIM29046.1 hypothetical protein CPJCM30710_17120 [Clostridium polyendosporum]
MKKKMLLNLAILLSISFSTTAFAAEEGTYKSNAGITPDGIFYKLDITAENFKLKLMNSGDNKIQYLLKIQEERLGEIEQLVEKNKVVLADKPITILEDASNKLSAEVDKLTENENITDIDTDIEKVVTEDTAITEKTDSEIEKITTKVDDFNKNSLEVLNKVKDKLPEQSFEKITQVIEMQQAKKEAVKEMVESRHALNTAKKELIEAKKALKEAEKSGNKEEIEKAQGTLQDALKQYDEKKNVWNIAKENKKEVIMKNKIGKGHMKTTDESKDDKSKTDEDKTEVSSSNTSVDNDADVNNTATNSFTTEVTQKEEKKESPSSLRNQNNNSQASIKKVEEKQETKVETSKIEEEKVKSNSASSKSQENRGNGKESEKKN